MATTMNEFTTDEDRIEALVCSQDFSGFIDLAHLSKISKVQALTHRLTALVPVEGVPFPVSLAIVRSMLLGFSKLEVTPDVFAKSMRFGVFGAHMPSVREVNYSGFQAGFAGIRLRQDLACSELELEDVALVDWRGFEFHSIPADTSDALWDLFDMEQSQYSAPDPQRRTFQVLDDRGFPIQRLRPILVSATRNRKNLRLDDGRVVPAYGMGHHGASISFTLVLTPKYRDENLAALLGEAYPALAGAQLLRPLVHGEAWLIATYDAPPMVRGLESKDVFLGSGQGAQDEWVELDEEDY